MAYPLRHETIIAVILTLVFALAIVGAVAAEPRTAVLAPAVDAAEQQWPQWLTTDTLPFERVAATVASDSEEATHSKACLCRCTVPNIAWSTGYGATCEAAGDNLDDNLWLQADYNCAWGNMDDLCTVFDFQHGACTWNGSQYQIDGSARYTCEFCYCIPG